MNIELESPILPAVSTPLTCQFCELGFNVAYFKSQLAHE